MLFLALSKYLQLSAQHTFFLPAHLHNSVCVEEEEYDGVEWRFGIACFFITQKDKSAMTEDRN